MNQQLATKFVNLTLGHVGREYPFAIVHVLDSPELVSPSRLHPIFHGSYDWHSCVHGWWQLFTLARLFPEISAPVMDRAESLFTPENAEGELQYLQAHPLFERPYGWGWLLMLHLELSKSDAVKAEVIEPMAKLISDRLQSYLARLQYPVRTGTHSNSAFSLELALSWSKRFDPALKECIGEWSRRVFWNDVAAPDLEPSGEDFLSTTLTEAVLMQSILEPQEFSQWFARYLPSWPRNLLEPVQVFDRTDGRMGHLDGLNLSRAWALRRLSKHAGLDSETLRTSANHHVSAAQNHLADNYMGEHWLATFALLAALEPDGV